MSTKKIYIAILFFLLVFTSSCADNSTPQQTTDSGQLDTQVAVQLTEIALSQPTASMTPTALAATDIPTSTAPQDQPTELPSPTNTSQTAQDTSTAEAASPTPSVPTSTNTAPAATRMPSPTATPPQFACQVTESQPEKGKTFKPDTDFDAVWTVKNVGAALWSSADVDYRYKDGEKIHQQEIYDLPEDTKPGESIDLTVDMKSPTDEDKYKTTWELRHGSIVICTLTVEINVNK